ncbi:cytosine permease [Gelidibacter japonicus]|uniref:cytosine permease n=1 Tax=Gelidibacter japonicus TaxID=1962232 RepID=UPI003A908301
METTENKENWFSIANIWFGCIASLPALLIGSTLVQSLTLFDAILVAILGYSFVLIFLSLLSVNAVKYRLNAVQLAERSFGYTGSKVIVGLIIGIASMVWFGIQTNIAGLSFSKVLLDVFEINLSVNVSSLFWGIIMVLTAVFGFKYVKWLNFIAVPSIVILIVFSLIITLENVSFTDILSYQPESEMPFIKAIGIVVGLIAVGGVISPDYNRFAKTPKTAVIGSVVGMLPAAVAFLAIGAILSIVKGTHDIVEIFAQIGYPIMAMSILILVTWTSNVMSAYSGGLGLNSTFHLSEKYRPYTTLIVGLIGTLLGVLGILDKFTEVAIILSAMIPPIAGVIIADYYFGKRVGDKCKSFDWIGIVSWLSGVSIVFLFESDIKNILGIVVSGFIYSMLNLILKKRIVPIYLK